MTRTQEVTTMRFKGEEDGSYEEFDALVVVEVADTDAERGIDVHLSPRTENVETFSLSASEAWRLAQLLARAATEFEDGIRDA